MATKVLHIILATLIFFSSTGFVVNKHYCQSELKSFRLYVKSDGCHTSQDRPSCPMHTGGKSGQTNEKRKDCCNDETEYVKIDIQQLLQSVEVYDRVAWMVAVPVEFCIQSPDTDFHTLHFSTYKPPPLVPEDMSPLLQVFRL